MTYVLSIEGMSCQHCVASVTAALRGLGLEPLDVSVGKAVVQAPAPPDGGAVRAALEAEGYALTALEPGE